MALVRVILFAIGGGALGSLSWWIGAPRPATTEAGGRALIGTGTGLISAAVAAASVTVWRAALLAPFVVVVVVSGLIDARTRVIPNRLTYPSLVASVAILVAVSATGREVDLPGAAVGALGFGGGLLGLALAVPSAMGMGDVKLAALAGVVLGAFGPRFVLAAASVAVLGAGIAAILALAAGRGRKHTIPFGPFLAFGAALAAFFAARLPP